MTFESCAALPGERRLAGRPRRRAGARDRRAPRPRRPRAGGRGRPRRGWRRRPSARSIARQLVDALEGPRPRHRPQRVGHRLRMLVRGQALAHDRDAPSRASARARRLAVGGDEALDAALAQPAASASQRASAPGSSGASGSYAGVMTTSAGDALGLRRAPGARSCARPSRRPPAPRVDARARRARRSGPRPGRRSRSPRARGRRRAPVPARVVGDDAVAGALQRLRAHDDVAPRGREAVQQHDGDPSPASSSGAAPPPVGARS